jgi:hypothetical protein
MSKQSVRDGGSVLKYFAAIPHIADEDLDLYEYRLYGHYKHVCGENNKPCEETVRETAKVCRISHPKVIEARRGLVSKGYITAEQADSRSAISIALTDVWAQNIARCSGSSIESTAASVQPGYQVGSDIESSGSVVEQNTHKKEDKNNTRTIRKTKTKDSGADAHKPVADALIYHPAMEAYQNVTHVRVTEAWRVKVARAVGQDIEDLMRWHALVEDWIGFGWNKMNVKGMLETFEGGGIKSRDGKAIPLAPSYRYESIEEDEDESIPSPAPKPATVAPDKPAVLVNGRNPHTQWKVAYGQLQLQMPREAFDTWLREAKLMAFKPEGNVFILEVANVYAQAWLEHRLKKVIVRTLERVVGAPIEVVFTLANAQAPEALENAA